MVTCIDGTVSDPSPASDVQVRAVEKALRVPLVAELFRRRPCDDRPSVTFWGQGFGAIPLAPSFTASLDQLHDAG